MWERLDFFPSNQMAADDIAPAKMGAEVVCSFYSPRNLEALKFLWALVHKTADNSPRWLDKDEAMEDLKMRARFARFVVGTDGKVELRPKSLKRINDEAAPASDRQDHGYHLSRNPPRYEEKRPPQGDRVNADGKTKPRRIITWRQRLILQAAARVDYLPFRASRQINVPGGVWGSLVDRGFLRHNPRGWEITEEGRAKLRHGGRTYGEG